LVTDEELAAGAKLDTEAEAIEIVVTGTRTPESVQRSSLRTGVVTRAEAERRGATHVGEALSGELGLQVNPNSYDYLGSPSGVQMQGLDGERVLILEDGERVVGDFGGVVDLASFSLVNVDRIEYVTGPMSSLYGTGALGGVVNIVTLAPRVEGVSGDGRVEVRDLPAYLTEGSSSYRRGPGWATVSGSYQHSEGLPLLPDRADLALPESDKAALALKLGAEHDSATSRLTARWSRDTLQGLQSELVPGLDPFLIDLPSTTDRFLLRGMQRVPVGERTALRASAAANWFVNESAKDRRGSPLDERRFRDHSLLSSELTATVALPALTLVAGARFEREAFAQRLERTEADNGEPVLTEVTEVAPSEHRSGAVFGQFGYEPHPDWMIMPGARFEYHDRFGAVWAPRLASRWRATKKLTLRASGGRGFRAPSAKEYGFFFDHSFLGYRVVGNEDLEPEASWGVNGDVSWVPIQWPSMRIRAGGFANWISNLITTQFIGQELTGVDDHSYVNVGHARTAGAEAALSWNLWSRVRTELGYAYLFTRNDDTGAPLESRPAHTALASLLLYPTRSLELVVRQRTVSSAYLGPGLRTPPFSTLDLRVAYRVLSSLQLYTGVLNALGARDDPMRPGDQRPVAGRTLLVGARLALPGDDAR
jgi:outer membrane receptor for ferrienterochelin and colicins